MSKKNVEREHDQERLARDPSGKNIANCGQHETVRIGDTVFTLLFDDLLPSSTIAEDEVY